MASSGGSNEGHGVEVAPGLRLPDAALQYSFSRSGGPGGQNVNKVATQVELRIDLNDLRAAGMPDAAIERLRDAEPGRITKADELIITSSESRSQHRNRQHCLERLREMLVVALARPKRRRKTRPSRGSVERRLAEKKQRGEIKSRRGRVDPPEGR
ncbi:MAG: alternative ribosome rescue aminoacyl-tRNA hydrolase ArfB [Phycisphaerales bacterium]